MRSNRLVVIFGLSFRRIMIQGCAIFVVSLTLSAKKNDFPISFSEGILGYDNELILSDGYEVVHHFRMEKSAFTWNWWYACCQPKRVDLSNEFEELVRFHNGVAIVNLKIKAEPDMSIIYRLIGILTLGVLAPNSVKATIEGDVIRLNVSTISQNDSIPPWFSSISDKG